ncbi:hypothetical protein SAY87_001428 [Trapa incisa]|uniref:Secreted protein n=1 Tax=Trapa incisa TaxID=236973 RepID=A0AAN7GV94_9MYRT|nr:hypothetical protein SAY87_001428 [Trapa incisa]
MASISSMFLLILPRIVKSVKIPFVSNIEMVLSNVTIYEMEAPKSYIRPGDAGFTIIASEITCNLSMSWHYTTVLP